MQKVRFFKIASSSCHSHAIKHCTNFSRENFERTPSGQRNYVPFSAVKKVSFFKIALKSAPHLSNGILRKLMGNYTGNYMFIIR